MGGWGRRCSPLFSAAGLSFNPGPCQPEQPTSPQPPRSTKHKAPRRSPGVLGRAHTDLACVQVCLILQLVDHRGGTGVGGPHAKLVLQQQVLLQPGILLPELLDGGPAHDRCVAHAVSGCSSSMQFALAGWLGWLLGAIKLQAAHPGSLDCSAAAPDTHSLRTAASPRPICATACLLLLTWCRRQSCLPACQQQLKQQMTCPAAWFQQRRAA